MTAPVAPALKPMANQNMRRTGQSFSLRRRRRAFDALAPQPVSLINGLETACSITPPSRSAFLTIFPADSSIPSTRSSSRFTPLTVVLTSESRGTVSFRMSSMIMRVASSTRKSCRKTTPRSRRGTAATPTMMMAAHPPSDAITCDLRFSQSVRESYPDGSRPFAWRVRLALPFLSLIRRLVVALPLERDGPVLLLNAMAGVVVRVLVALAVAELAQTGMAGSLLQVQRHRVDGRGVLGSTAEGRDHTVRLRRLRQVDGGLGEVQPRLGQPHVLDGLGRRHR